MNDVYYRGCAWYFKFVDKLGDTKVRGPFLTMKEAETKATEQYLSAAKAAESR